MKLPKNLSGDKIAFISFVSSATFLLALGVFSWGYKTASARIFPYSVIADTRESIKAVRELYELEVENPRSGHEIISSVPKKGVTVNKLEPAQEEDYILVTLFRDIEFMAQILDRKGEVLHEWRLPRDADELTQAQDTGVPLSKKNWMIHGVEMTDAGELYVVVETRALMKLDKDSEVLWTLYDPIHHSVTIAPDGTIWTLNRRKISDPDEKHPLSDADWYWEEQVIQVSPEGEILQTFSIPDIIYKNQYEGILFPGGVSGHPRIQTKDPLHTNDVDVLTAEQAANFPGEVKAGDVMLSHRTINNVFIFDPETQKIEWSMTGPFIRQHDPEVSEDGTLLVYDNRTADAQPGNGDQHFTEPQPLGYSRIIKIDPISREVVFEYQGSEAEPFYTSIMGKLDELPNGNILIADPEAGRIFEIEPNEGEIVWEYVNALDDGYVGRISQAIPLTSEQISFLED
ncbi:MAG: arylsulfotransferase family protein [Cyanobacteria bacterium P01_H01_bin.15]